MRSPPGRRPPPRNSKDLQEQLVGRFERAEKLLEIGVVRRDLGRLRVQAGDTGTPPLEPLRFVEADQGMGPAASRETLVLVRRSQVRAEAGAGHGEVRPAL